LNSGSVHKRAGFSLIEFAIVLAIIGIVLAALWGVVSIVRENIKREETAEQMTAIVSKIRDYYMGRACVSTNFDCTGSGAVLTETLFRQNLLLPEQLRDRTAVVLVADHPWGASAADGSSLAGGSLIVRAVGDGRDPSGLGAFQIELLGLKESSCVALASSLSGAGAPKGLVTMTINGTSVTLPATPEAAGGACTTPSGATNTIIMAYRLRP
jgi:prepilin-type N-terminal cleavage/methylation domain-containing protein